MEIPEYLFIKILKLNNVDKYLREIHNIINEKILVEKRGYLYVFIKTLKEKIDYENGLVVEVKIGKSKQENKRSLGYRTMNPDGENIIALECFNMNSTEKILHKYLKYLGHHKFYKSIRNGGEHFLLDKNTLEIFIEACFILNKHYDLKSKEIKEEIKKEEIKKEEIKKEEIKKEEIKEEIKEEDLKKIRQYKCIRCGYETYHSSHMKYHLKRKIMCMPKLCDTFLSKEIKNDILNICNYCSENYKYSYNKILHEESCVKKKELELLYKQNEEIRLEHEKLKSKIITIPNKSKNIKYL
jgi:hypothetical protein